MKKGIRLLFGSICCVSLFLTGCQKQESDEVKEKKVEEKIIGEKLSGENVYKVSLTNDTGNDIVGFSIKTDTMDNFGENMLKEDEVFADEETRTLYYDASEAIEANEKAQEGPEMQVSPEYTTKLDFEDKSYELHAFPFEDVKEVTIRLEDDICFIEYESVDQEAAVSTKEAEQRIKEELEIQSENQGNNTEEEQSQQIVAEQQPVQQPVQEQQVVQQPVQEQQPVQQPVQETPPADTGSSANEGCLGGSVETW